MATVNIIDIVHIDNQHKKYDGEENDDDDDIRNQSSDP